MGFKIKQNKHPKQVALESIKNILMFSKGTSYEEYIKKEIKKLKNIIIERRSINN